jgi:hypothetical protein
MERSSPAGDITSQAEAEVLRNLRFKFRAVAMAENLERDEARKETELEESVANWASAGANWASLGGATE